MEQLVIKKDLLKITNDFILGVILNEIIEIAQKFRKEFIDNNWHCAEYFEINIEKISDDNMLNLSKSSIRRYIKKLSNLGFILVDTTEKRHKYKVNFETINSALQKIGGETIEKVKPIKTRDKKQNKNSENDVINIEDKFDGYTQTNMFSDKEIAPEEQGLSQEITKIKNNVNYNIIEEIRQDNKNEHFVNMFDSIYRVIVDVMTTDSKYIRINKENKPISIVRSIFSKIDFMDIESIIHSLKRVEHKIINFKSYIVTAIYNHYIEKEFKLQNDLYVNERILL